MFRLELSHNLSGYSLVAVAVFCVWLGGHSGNSSLTKLGEGFGAAALLAFQAKKQPEQKQPEQPVTPKG